MDIAFWNIVHDGGIDVISGCIPGDILLTIGIEHLCDQLPTAARALQVSLRGCRLFIYTPFGKPAITDLQKIAAHSPEILSARMGQGRVEVCCASGKLEVAYQTAEVRLIEGMVIGQPELEAAAHRSVAVSLENKNRSSAAG